MEIHTWKQTGRIYTHNQQAVFYQETGQERPHKLLLIHGFPTASWDWSKIWAQLGKQFHVIAPDMLGFGFSGKQARYPYSIMDQATMHENLLADKRIDSIHILAHDYGDTVAQELLARLQERQKSGQKGLNIQSVCYLNGGIYPDTHRPRLIQKILDSPLGKIIWPVMSKSNLRRTFKRIFGANTQPTEQEIDEFWHLITHNNGKRVIPRTIGYMRERQQHFHRWVNILRETSVPSRLINGTDDPISGRHVAQRYLDDVPNPDVILLEGIGHYPNVEAPKQVLTHYLSFVSQHL